ncbi:MAG: ATP-binding protein [Longimicrobiales bacterium]
MQSKHVLEIDNDLSDVEPAVRYLMERCREMGFDERRLRLNFRVGLTEALINAILYGNEADPRRVVRIEVWLDPERATIEVSDQGGGFDPERLPDPTLPSNRMRSGGRGIFLIRKLMDEVEFNERGNCIRMVLHSRGATPGRDGELDR